MIDKVVGRCIIADPDTGNYIRSLRHGQYEFTSNIVNASKFTNYETADTFIKILKRNPVNNDFVIVPVKITYELLDEEALKELKG